MLTSAEFLIKHTVDSFIEILDEIITKEIGFVRVVGEISNVTKASSGHWYFNLRGKNNLIRCVMFRHQAQLIGWTISEGISVEVEAFIGIYKPRGELQLQIKLIKPCGEGSLYLAFEKLKVQLQAEGIFAPERKKTIPQNPKSIGIITSSQADALQDVLKVIREQSPHINVWLYPTSVQGKAAANEIINAITNAEKHNQVELLLIVRGGGSIEDLWCFNEEILIRKLAQTQLPTISGVGHESDTTLCDFVCDVRAATPTAAANLLPKTAFLQNELNNLKLNIKNQLTDLIARKAQQVDYCQKIIVSLQTSFYKHLQDKLLTYRSQILLLINSRINSTKEQFKFLAKNLNLCVHQNLQEYHTKLAHLQQILIAYDPLQPQKKGYVLIRSTVNNQLIDKAHNLNVNDTFVADFSDGTVSAKITQIKLK